MNLLHMKYAVEIAEMRSINKAAKKLYVGQPTLSRAIKELEESINTTLFDRSAKGMTLTPEGETFVHFAKAVLKQVDDIESMFNSDMVSKNKFSISVPRASYISHAFVEFSKQIKSGMKTELIYQETNSMLAINNILNEDFRLGIVRYAKNYDKYYKALMDEKGLDYELISEFNYVLIMSKHSPLAKKEKITFDDLHNYIKISHADHYVPSLPFNEVKKSELPDDFERCIYVYERGSQFDLLTCNTETFMWVSPIPTILLKRYGLVQRKCSDNKRIFKDVLIHRKKYVLSELDNAFIGELIKAKREIINIDNLEIKTK